MGDIDGDREPWSPNSNNQQLRGGLYHSEVFRKEEKIVTISFGIGLRQVGPELDPRPVGFIVVPFARRKNVKTSTGSRASRVSSLLHSDQVCVHVQQLEPDEFRTESALTPLGSVNDFLAEGLDIVLNKLKREVNRAFL